MPRLPLAALAVLVGCGPAALLGGSSALDGPLDTPAERSGYRATASYDQAVDFVDRLSDRSRLHVGAFGRSGQGRALPLAVWGAADATAQAVRQSGKTRVLVLGSIHGGEVAGTDAALALLRDLAAGEHAEWADSLALMVVPIYNADGHHAMGLGNRPLQDGPVEGMGRRPNAQGLDLNRDFMKAASPEAQALIALIRDADPHVVVDLHTTNGTVMGYHLTYAPGLSPNTPAAIDADLRDRWLPAISAEILASDDFATYHYGNVPGAFGEPAAAPRGWYSFSAQPRFSTNYVGVRGRYGVLSEAYSYAPFEERVEVSRRFTEEVLNQAWAQASLVRRRAADADRQSAVGRPVALRATWEALPRPVEVLLGEADTLRHPVTGEPFLRRRDVRTPETMPAFVRFAATETATAPSAYVVHLEAQAAVRPLLDLHGIEYEGGLAWGRARERFRIDSVAVAPRPFQGATARDVFGAWEPVEGESGPPPRLAPALIVPVDQPLGRLAVMLLEPRSDDGVFAWGLLPEGAYGGAAPIERIP